MAHSMGDGGSALVLYTTMTFGALADAIMQPQWRHAVPVGVSFLPGPIQLGVDLFVKNDIDHSQFVPAAAGNVLLPALSLSTARLLDRGAEQLVQSGLVRYPPNPLAFPAGGLFAALSRQDRLHSLSLLDRLAVPLHLLPPPYLNNAALVRTMVDSFYQLTMFGYYSEWFGYGTTRFMAPDYRCLEFEPPGWGRIGYPGPAFGYRDYRGFLLFYPQPDKGCTHD